MAETAFSVIKRMFSGPWDDSLPFVTPSNRFLTVSWNSASPIERSILSISSSLKLATNRS